MSRLAKLVAVAAATAVVGVAAPTAEATLPPPDAPTTTVASTTTDAPGTTAPVAERGGAGAVDVVKDEDEDWNLRRIATVVGVTVVVLAIAGFVYGRVRSTRRPVTSQALATTSPNVEEPANY